MNNPLRVACALMVLMFAVGCGQSGPLFVPGNPSTVEPQPQQQTNQEDDEEDENGAASP